MRTLGERMRQFGETQFGSVADFTAAMGYANAATLYKYFNDSQKPGADILTRMAEFGCNINWLLTGIGSMYNDDVKAVEIPAQANAVFPR